MDDVPVVRAQCTSWQRFKETERAIFQHDEHCDKGPQIELFMKYTQLFPKIASSLFTDTPTSRSDKFGRYLPKRHSIFLQILTSIPCIRT